MLVAIHRHKPLIEGSTPNPLLNTEFHSVAARSSNALGGYVKMPPPLVKDGTIRSFPYYF